MDKLLWLFVVALLILPSFPGEARKRKVESDDGNVNVGAERPFDAVNIFGDFGRKSQLPNADENKIWWERMVRGEVGRDRFLILCALKYGNWKNLGDIRDYIEFKIEETYAFKNLHRLLVLMAGKRMYTPRGGKGFQDDVGEGWLEKNRHAGSVGIESEWRIEPSVYPLLYFLLMGCPEDARCE